MKNPDAGKVIKAVEHEVSEDTSFEVTCKIHENQPYDQSAECRSCRWPSWDLFTEVDKQAEFVINE